MKTIIPCYECGDQQKTPPALFFADYYDEHIIKAKCPMDHAVVAIVQNPKFEILLETGSDSLIVGQTLQASAAFSSARERAFEFATQVLLRKLGVSREQYQVMFKHMTNQSERQFGAFLATYLAVTNRPFNPNNEIPTFRNNVIHKGKVPYPDAAHSFCSSVFNEIRNLCETLRSECKEQITEIITQQNAELVTKLGAQTRIATIALNSIYSIISDPAPDNFDSALEKYKTWKHQLSEEYLLKLMAAMRHSF
jgi:hypothetical protein